jgi:hypothetical protein
MVSRLLDGANVPQRDQPLIEAARRLGLTSFAQGMSIGIEGDDGRIYCVVQTESVCKAAQFFESARSLGFDIAEGRRVGDQVLQKVLRHAE